MEASQQLYKADAQTSYFTDQEVEAALTKCHMAEANVCLVYFVTTMMSPLATSTHHNLFCWFQV